MERTWNAASGQCELAAKCCPTHTTTQSYGRAAGHFWSAWTPHQRGAEPASACCAAGRRSARHSLPPDCLTGESNAGLAKMRLTFTLRWFSCVKTVPKKVGIK